jgi:hypothetical protein
VRNSRSPKRKQRKKDRRIRRQTLPAKPVSSKPAESQNGHTVCTLYHFTSLMHLPDILREGITRGEVPLENVQYRDRPQAPNLTRKSDPRSQEWTKGCVMDKARVRLTVKLRTEAVTSFREVKQKYRMRSRWIKALAPAGQHFDWFFAFGGVPLERIAKIEVAIHTPFEYVEPAPQVLESLLVLVEKESRKLTERRHVTGFSFFEDSDVLRNSWLFDGWAGTSPNEYPAVPGVFPGVDTEQPIPMK